MDQQQTDIKELLSLYNNAIQIKKRAEKKLIRFTNCLSELDRRNCGTDVIEQINLVRQKIKEERKNQAEQTVRNSYVQLQNQMDQSSLMLKQKLSEKELQLESMEIEFKCQLQQQQQVINNLNLQIEEVKDYDQEQILNLTQKNQQLLNLIEDLNKQITELKQILEYYQNEEFKSQQNNFNSIKVSQNSQMLSNIKKFGNRYNNQTTESMDQCQFETLASEVRYQEIGENLDDEIFLGSFNQYTETKELQSPIKVQDQSYNQNQINEQNFVIEELKERIQNLQQEKQRLIDRMDENQENFNNFKEKNQLNETNLNKQINNLIVVNQDLITKEQNLEVQIFEQKNEIQKLEQLIENLETSQESLKQKDEMISKLNDEQQLTKTKLKQFEEQIAFIRKLEGEIQHRQHQIVEKEEEIKNFKQSIEKQQISKQTLNEQISKIQKQLDNQIQQNLQLQNENKCLIQEKKSLKDEIIGVIKEQEQQKQELTMKVQILESQIHDLQLEQDQKLSQQENLNMNESNMTIQVQELMQQLSDLEIKNKVLDQENNTQKKEIEIQNEQRDRFQIQIEELNQKHQRIQQDMNIQGIDKQRVDDILDDKIKELELSRIQNQQFQEEINGLKKNIEELRRINNRKDLQRDEQIKFQKGLENEIKILEVELKDSKQQFQQECKRIVESYKEELRLMQEQLVRSSENIKRCSPIRDIKQEDKYKEQINRLNDELRINKLQIAQLSTVNNQLKQQQKDVVLKLQNILKLVPGGDQDLNDLIKIIENNLQSCQSNNCAKQCSKRTSLIDTTKMLMNKARTSIGSNRGSILIQQENGYRNSLSIQNIPFGRKSNKDLQQILDDISDQDIIQQ
ncbi:unnamed protein product [Paramecium sonneborni]|uniref:Uncharacterized protein n=1 Tax=Paramecium sonneborni TaxID=65129 RepID=A0A8S1R730_9CILI|nr:unnamed protein product [Paramecium sonneborni]